jgi:hypothetical protein
MKWVVKRNNRMSFIRMIPVTASYFDDAQRFRFAAVVELEFQMSVAA